MNTPNRALTSVGCFGVNAIVAALVVVLATFAFTLIQGGGLFSPGGLSARAGAPPLGGVGSHAEITHCTQCHPAPFSGSSMADACISCHTDLRQDPNNFHTLMLAEGQRSGCYQCHSEHLGTEGTQIKDQIAAFPHDRLGFSLLAHQKMADGTPFACNGCHPVTYVSFSPGVCASCHTLLQPEWMATHNAVFGPDCRACHDGVDRYGHAFDHQKVSFTLEGRHALLTCEKCHNGARTPADLIGTPRTCAACHAQNDPHKGQYGQECGACHSTAAWKPATFDHTKSVFPLTGAHQTVACQGCHANSVFKGTPQTCAACHAKNDAHKGQYGQECGACHSTAAWKPATFDHTKSAFPLAGKHQAVPCQNCHIKNVFKGTATACVGCHADPVFHRGLLGNACATCHTATGWVPAKFSQAHTFPISHGRSNNTCRSCHPSSLSQYSCVSCHSQAKMASEHRGRGDITDCVKCHADGREGD